MISDDVKVFAKQKLAKLVDSIHTSQALKLSHRVAGLGRSERTASISDDVFTVFCVFLFEDGSDATAAGVSGKEERLAVVREGKDRLAAESRNQRLEGGLLFRSP